MKIHFGLQFDGEKVWDFGLNQDFENLIVGPVGFINFLKEQLGEFKPQEESIARILNYEKIIDGCINDYPSLLDSYKVDSFAFASKLLEIRDWLKLNEVIDKKWSKDNLRFHLIEKAENQFSIDSFSDDFITVKNQLKQIVFEENLSIVLYNSLDALPLYLKRLFEEFDSKIITEYTIDQGGKAFSDLSKVINYIQGNDANKIEGDESFIISQVNDEEELVPHLVQASQNENVLFVGNHLPSSLDLVITHNNGNTIGLQVEKPGDYWKQLPELLLCIGEERLDIRKVFQLLNHKYTLFGKASYWIQSQLEYSQSFDFEKWFATWKERGIEGFEEIKNTIQEWLIDRPVLFSDSGTAKSEELITFYASVLKQFDSYQFKGFSLQSFTEFKSDISNTINFLEEYDEVPLSRLKTVFRRIRAGKTISSSEHMTNSALKCKSPGNVVYFQTRKEQTYLVLNGFEIEDKGLNKLLFESEIQSLKNIDPDLIEENGIKVWREDICRLLSSSKQVVLINVLNRKGELQEKPFIINLAQQIANQSIDKELQDIIPLSFTEPNTNSLAPVRVKKYWELKNKTKETIQFKEFESFSSINELIHYPHAYFLTNSLGVYPKGFPDFESVFAAKGTLSHAVIEHLVNHNHLDASKQEIIDLTETLIPEKAAVLNIPKFRMDALEVKTNLVNAIPELNKLIKEMKLEKLSIQMEKKVLKEQSVFNVGLKGFIDMVLYNDKKPVAIIDIKYTGYTKRKNDIENSADYQLALYSRLMDDDNLPKGYFLVKEAKLMTNDPSFFGERANTFDFSSSTEEQIIQLEKAVKKRKEEIISGKVEVGINEKLEDLDFWIELDFTSNTSWKEDSKNSNPYEQFKNLLG